MGQQFTTISLSKELADYLRSLKKVPRESFSDVIIRLINIKEELENGSEPRS